eukprot:CAMPEP_0206168618 /NCGR_PEP_ID=MMETSP1474-20131121/32777_1 /ASSEMBLY_ACC=CAM_ASM_001110 /TAXON_ID=97495 /ORGANISM="Imantonia sp., Strain RCC918" /LENGTH=78 /DNA_ID=CAMNT_0053574111 /DNA_START=195 /DNA_END=431 /DNA_ORIENTATION=-
MLKSFILWKRNMKPPCVSSGINVSHRVHTFLLKLTARSVVSSTLTSTKPTSSSALAISSGLVSGLTTNQSVAAAPAPG